MPFKTKKRKLKAGMRHFVFNEGAIKIIDSAEEEFKNDAGYKKQVTTGENLSYLRGDLLKIIIISAFILAAQIMLRLTLA
ncbi:MAG: hypothetical protein Q7S45_03545 [Candidatus Curtissbacteria bacterium]|nr:hypothetical protein [Candidatus Curtissbacteria bacterium]